MNRFSPLRRVLLLVLAAALILSLPVLAADPPEIAGTGAIIINADTGAVLYEKNADYARPAASMTKVMSMYLVLEAIQEGRLSLDEFIPASPQAVYVSNAAGYSGHEQLQTGHTYKVEDLIKLVMTASCNGSIIALCEYLEGDEAAFVQRMNATAASWGLDAHYADCCGFKDSGNAVSPRAMAEIARRILTDHPEILDYSSLKSTTFEGKTYNSTNTLMRNGTVEGIDGLKTGYTGGAGYCFTGTAKRDGVRVISVVMNSTSYAQRMEDSRSLLEYAFQQVALTLQADKDITTTLVAEGSLLYPYADAVVTAQFTDVDAPQPVPCDVVWKLNGAEISRESISLTNGAASTLTFRPGAAEQAELSAQVRFPDGDTSQAALLTLPVSQDPLTLSGTIQPQAATLTQGEGVTVRCSVVSDQGVPVSFAAGWYLDGKAVGGNQFPDFRAGGAAAVVLSAGDLPAGTHTVEFRCNTGQLPQLEQESYAAVLTVEPREPDPAETQEEPDQPEKPQPAQEKPTQPEAPQPAQDPVPPQDPGPAPCPRDRTCPLAKFQDLSPAAWYHDGVHYVLEHGLMQGVASGRFAPNDQTTRAALVTILYRMDGSPAAPAAGFSDVPANSWYSGAVGWARANGITDGYGDGRFGPGDAVTRQQLVTILYRYAQYEGYDVSARGALSGFSDHAAVSGWALTSMEWACGGRLISGFSDGTLRPGSTALRTETATLLARAASGVGLAP